MWTLGILKKKYSKIVLLCNINLNNLIKIIKIVVGIFKTLYNFVLL